MLVFMLDIVVTEQVGSLVVVVDIVVSEGDGCLVMTVYMGGECRQLQDQVH